MITKVEHRHKISYQSFSDAFYLHTTKISRAVYKYLMLQEDYLTQVQILDPIVQDKRTFPSYACCNQVSTDCTVSEWPVSYIAAQCLRRCDGYGRGKVGTNVK